MASSSPQDGSSPPAPPIPQEEEELQLLSPLQSAWSYYLSRLQDLEEERVLYLSKVELTGWALEHLYQWIQTVDPSQRPTTLHLGGGIVFQETAAEQPDWTTVLPKLFQNGILHLKLSKAPEEHVGTSSLLEYQPLLQFLKEQSNQLKLRTLELRFLRFPIEEGSRLFDLVSCSCHHLRLVSCLVESATSFEQRVPTIDSSPFEGPSRVEILGGYLMNTASFLTVMTQRWIHPRLSRLHVHSRNPNILATLIPLLERQVSGRTLIELKLEGVRFDARSESEWMSFCNVLQSLSDPDQDGCLERVDLTGCTLTSMSKAVQLMQSIRWCRFVTLEKLGFWGDRNLQKEDLARFLMLFASQKLSSRNHVLNEAMQMPYNIMTEELNISCCKAKDFEAGLIMLVLAAGGNTTLRNFDISSNGHFDWEQQPGGTCPSEWPNCLSFIHYLTSLKLPFMSLCPSEAPQFLVDLERNLSLLHVEVDGWIKDNNSNNNNNVEAEGNTAMTKMECQEWLDAILVRNRGIALARSMVEKLMVIENKSLARALWPRLLERLWKYNRHTSTRGRGKASACFLFLRGMEHGRQ